MSTPLLSIRLPFTSRNRITWTRNLNAAALLRMGESKCCNAPPAHGSYHMDDGEANPHDGDQDSGWRGRETKKKKKRQEEVASVLVSKHTCQWPGSSPATNGK